MMSEFEARIKLVETVATLNEQIKNEEITVDEYEAALFAAIKEYKLHA